MSRFPINNESQDEMILTVDELKDLYENVVSQVNADLLEATIAPSLDKPTIPRGLEQVLTFSESGDPEIPEDITVLDGTALGKLFSFISSWTSYVQSEVTRGKCILTVSKRTAKVIEAALRTYYKEAEGLPANQIDDKILLDSRYVEADVSVLKSDVFVKKAESRYDSYRRALHLVSRELTRRGEDFKDTNKNSSSRWRKSAP